MTTRRHAKGSARDGAEGRAAGTATSGATGDERRLVSGAGTSHGPSHGHVSGGAGSVADSVAHSVADNAVGEWRLVSRVLVPCQVRAVKAARDHVARLVTDNGLAALLDEAELVASEIITNAIVHGSPAGLAVLLEVSVAAAAVRVSVLDYSDHVPVLDEQPTDTAESGRGLHLVNSVTKSWGARTCPLDGFSKVVWAELA